MRSGATSSQRWVPLWLISTTQRLRGPTIRGQVSSLTGLLYRQESDMSAPTDSNATAPAASGTVQLPTMPRQLNALERALAAAIQDATKIGDLLDALRSARLWLPLPAPGGPSPAPA